MAVTAPGLIGNQKIEDIRLFLLDKSEEFQN